MENNESGKNIFGLCIFAAAIVLGVFLVFRQIIAVQRVRIEQAVALAQKAPPPIPLVPGAAVSPADVPRKVVEMPREIEKKDILEEYEQEDKKPRLLQIFRMGEALAQPEVEGVEYVREVTFRRQVGTGRVLADVIMMNDSGAPVTPRFQIMLFNSKTRFLCRDTMLSIKEELPPGEKKTVTLSFPHGPESIAFYEVRRLE